MANEPAHLVLWSGFLGRSISP